MKIDGTPKRSIWVSPTDDSVIQIIDQRYLPHGFVTEDLRTSDEAARSIKEMHVRGAPLIGITAAYGLYLAALEAASAPDFRAYLREAAAKLNATRPTAVNLQWALERQMEAANSVETIEEVTRVLFENAGKMADEDVETNRLIGQHGLSLLQAIAEKKGDERINILTHCNAGWLATVDYGTATSPIYQAHDLGLNVHVWVDETRPRNQGARITAWELGKHGVPHTVIPDNTGGHLMQHGLVDICFVGSDRTTFTGDVANKIGTYLKALAAHDNDVPFYVTLPGTTFDWTLRDGVKEIPIEQRSDHEVKYIAGLHEDSRKEVLLTPADSPAANYAFDVTPARLVTGLITERGVCAANERSILDLYPEYAPIA